MNNAHIQSKIDPLDAQDSFRRLHDPEHRGFDIEFDNGYSISVIWHNSCNCTLIDDDENKGEASEVEVWVWCEGKELKSLPGSGFSDSMDDGPRGWIPVDQLVEIMYELKNLPVPTKDDNAVGGLL